MLELVQRAGAHPTESSELVTLFSAAWSQAELESHRRAAAVVARVAREALDRAADAAQTDRQLDEWALKQSITEELSDAGLDEVDAIVAVGPNSADGHYEPTPRSAAPIVADRVLLVDLWGREPGSVFADQTWMGYLGTDVPERVGIVWQAVLGARTAALEFLRDRAGDGGEPLRGCDVDDAARAVITDAGFGEQFIHRTGHSIDGELHGLGPNIDGIETRDERRLLPGVGFSVEPGVYLPGQFGVRSEINVYLSPDGPEVTTPEPQSEIPALLAE